MDDEPAILRAHKAFYAAFEAMDFDAMGRVWARRPTDTCIHPGWEVLTGWAEIRESWRAIFANTGFMRFEATDVQVDVVSDTGRVTCVENIFSVIDGHTIHSRVATTNLFVRTGEGWRMVLHHGSPIASSQSVVSVDEDEELN
jgi:ketosteroid isomerase-like protein